MDITSVHQLGYLYAHQQEIAEEFGIHKSVAERQIIAKENKSIKKEKKEVRKSEKEKRLRT